MELNIKSKRTSKNYRMSDESIRLIATLADAKDTTQSDVLDSLVLMAVPRILEGLKKTPTRRRTAQ